MAAASPRQAIKLKKPCRSGERRKQQKKRKEKNRFKTKREKMNEMKRVHGKGERDRRWAWPNDMSIAWKRAQQIRDVYDANVTLEACKTIVHL